MTTRKAATPAAKRPRGASKAPQIVARYDAAGHGKRLAGWNPPSSGPTKSVDGLERIRNRARDALRNDWSSASTLNKKTTALIGIGIVPRFKRVKAARRKEVITDLWDDFTHECDADCVSTFYGLQTLSVLTWFSGGEVFIRFRDRNEAWGLAVPLQIQLLESEYVPLLDADTWPGLPERNIIRSGIEFDKYGRRRAYWMYREHPGEMSRFSTPTSDQLVRVSADMVEHMYEPPRPGQLRGVSLQSTVLTKLRDIGDYEDAVLVRQKLANLFTAFLKEMGGAQQFGAGIDPLTMQPVDDGDSTEDGFGLDPGTIQKLPRGWEMQFANPPEAGTTYSDYLRTSYLGVAAGAGVPYELMSGDIRDVSDRTMRVIINEFRRACEQQQWQTIIPKMCRATVRHFARQAALVGKITTAEIDLVSRAEWAPHGWPHIHPVQDPQGKQIEIDGGQRSRSSVIAERGDDPDAVDQERADDMAREKKYGLQKMVQPSGNNLVPKGDGQQANDGTLNGNQQT